MPDAFSVAPPPRTPTRRAIPRAHRPAGLGEQRSGRSNRGRVTDDAPHPIPVGYLTPSGSAGSNRRGATPIYPRPDLLSEVAGGMAFGPAGVTPGLLGPPEPCRGRFATPICAYREARGPTRSRHRSPERTDPGMSDATLGDPEMRKSSRMSTAAREGRP
jgi:hypothetical protein